MSDLQGKILTDIDNTMPEMNGETIAIFNDLNARYQQFLDNDATLKDKIKNIDDEAATKEEVTALQRTVESHSVEKATQNASGHIKLSDIPTPVDYGRYQADFGLDGAVLNGCFLNSSNQITLSLSATIKDNSPLRTGSTTIYNGVSTGQGLNSVATATITKINYIEAYISKNSSPTSNLIMYLYDDTSKTLLATITKASGDITDQAYNRFTPTVPIDFTPGHVLLICFAAPTATTTSNYNIGDMPTGTLANESEISSSNNWSTFSYSDGSVRDLALKISYDSNSVTGTATKTVTPSDLKKWGNAKWMQNTPVNTTVKCDVINGISGKVPIPIIMSIDKKIDTGTLNSLSDSTMTDYLQIKGTSLVINLNYNGILNQYNIATRWGDNRSPKNFTFEGKDKNGNWIILDTQVNQTFIAQTLKKYIFPNDIPYVAYRLNISLNNGDATLSEIAELEIFGVLQILKSNITSLQDLSDIDIIQYPSITLRWTLSRNSVNDASPTISNPSLTWEGGIDVIQPTKPMGVDFNSGTVVANQYYTALSITNGKGKLTRFSASISNVSSSALTIRLTVDGATYVFNGTDGPIRGMAMRNSNGYSNGNYIYDWLGELYFKNNLKIEVANISNTSPISFSADYALV